MTPWRIGNLIWAVLLVTGASVQLNDPDPALWVGAYTLSAVLSIAAATERLPWVAPAIWAGVTLTWALVIAASGVDESNPMRGPGGLLESGLFAEEIVRESMGLTLMAIGAMLQAAVLRRRAA